jgi:cell division protein ZapA (FtsZ GTPase activity inhibitor)
LETIRVNIAGKEFPLSVEDGSQHDVKQAAAIINQKIKQHQEQYKVEVKDALAMCALEFVTQNMQLQQKDGEWQSAGKSLDTVYQLLRNTEL